MIFFVETVNTCSDGEPSECLSRKHAFVRMPPEGIPVEDIILAVGNIIGDGIFV